DSSDFLAIVGERFFHLVNQAVQTVAGFNLLALLHVVRSVRFSIAHHLVDLIFRKTGRRSDGYLLLAPGTHVFGRDVDDAIGVGIVVLRSMSLVKTPPSVSMPRDSGVTSSSRMSVFSPDNTPAWTAAPIATTSSGFTLLFGSLPNISRTICCTFGMRVEPPTKT